MKKLFIIPVIAGLLSTGLYANAAVKNVKDDDGSRVSYSVINQFKADFRDAKNVTWTITDNCQKAEFILNGVKTTAFYNFSGDFMGTTERVAYSAVSERAQKEIAAKYKGYAVGDVIKLQTTESTQLFVDLKNDKEEVLVRVSPTSTVSFFQQVK
ncbi:hypothetical protein EOD41_19040 [Mucilaginibacter limnophilus]|uniref:Beta-lactamase-inhibitor-like PepSY-like domain-containing protein n=1 Tax=Mucilaginibacter limnophilus TaxID=1932778 RepID=A0A3S2XY89_9SPHI|nr:hypothetical protein [Mucilaginibacter limnophilus]RVT97261.1 hypothetical protein EOD41_19040 [Mucilaginibacter limnophilus]